MFLKTKKIVGLSAAIVLVVAWFAWGILENSYVNLPRSAKPQDGRTIPHAIKGVIVYITKGEWSLLSRLTWIQLGSGAIVVLVILIHRGDPFRARD
jgi:hypothetical protein